MKKEVEILFELKDSIEKTKQKLTHLVKGKQEKVVDIYYYSDSHEKLKPKNNSLKACLRIRQKEDKNFLAYKNDYFDENNTWLYSDEYETEFESLEKMKGVLENLGFKELIIIENIKSIFTNDDFEVCLEDVKDLGNFIEVEYHFYDDNIDINLAKQNIRNWIKENNINVREELNMGKPELMLRKFDKF